MSCSNVRVQRLPFTISDNSTQSVADVIMYTIVVRGGGELHAGYYHYAMCVTSRCQLYVYGFQS